MVVTKDEFDALLVHPAFKLYRQFLEKLLSVEKEEWAKGSFTYSSIDETVQKNSEAIGRVSILTSLLSEDCNYEQIMDTIYDK